MTFNEDLIELTHQLKGHCRRLCGGNPHATEDLLQATLMRAVEKQSQFREGTNLRAWLFTIAKNTHYNDYRRRQHRNEVELLKADELRALPQSDTLIERDLKRALAVLPDRMARPLIMIATGASYDEVANKLQVDVGTVKSRVSRARQIVKTLMEANIE